VGEGVNKKEAKQKPTGNVSYGVNNIYLACRFLALKEGSRYGYHRTANKTVGDKDRSAGSHRRREAQHFASYPEKRQTSNSRNLPKGYERYEDMTQEKRSFRPCPFCQGYTQGAAQTRKEKPRAEDQSYNQLITTKA